MPLRHAITKTKSKYGSAAEFLVKFNPAMQTAAAQNEERAFLGTAPTLTTLRHAYNDEVAEAWLMAQLEDLNDFCGVSIKMTTTQQENVARIFMTEYHYLKASEILLFFHQLKCGNFGEFYGVVDPLRITAAMRNFLKERRIKLMKFENIENEKRREDWTKGCVTREEYEQMKKQNGNDQDKK